MIACAANVRVVIDTDHHPALTATHEIMPYARSYQMESPHHNRRSASTAGPCSGKYGHVTFSAFQPGQIFNVAARQTLPRG
ncbi:hypothetical protein D3C73_1464200 [compost metagenome]